MDLQACCVVGELLSKSLEEVNDLSVSEVNTWLAFLELKAEARDKAYGK